jgi:cytochrome c oxidase cbb3-type subunit 3
VIKELIFGVIAVFSAPLCAMPIDDTTPSIERGAIVFLQRCVLCHGSQGTGEGAIPLKIKSYPNTNILIETKTHSEKEVYEAIVYGGMLANISNYMPPMGNELTWTELQSVTLFVLNLRRDTPTYAKLLMESSEKVGMSRAMGKSIFESRCILCHGENGEGNGRMAKIITDPPPFDLTKSVMPQDYLTKIIAGGGEAVGRSPQMPPWGDQLTSSEVAAVAQYIATLRN